MAADDGRAEAVGGHEVVATGAGEFRFDAGYAAEIPNLQGTIMTAGHHFDGLLQILGGHHFAAMTSECVLEGSNKNVKLK